MTPTATENAPITIRRPETGHLASPHASLMREAHDLTVSDIESHGRGLALIKTCVQARKAVVDLFAEPKAAAHRAHKFITEMETALLKSPDSAKAEAMAKVTDYEEHARKVAEEEARRQQEEARKIEEERQLAEAEATEKAGDHELADQIMNERPVVPVVTPMPLVAKVAGVSSQTRYSAEVTDLAALVKHAAAHPEHLYLLEPNMPNLNRLATAQRENMKIPGVRAVKNVLKSVRS